MSTVVCVLASGSNGNCCLVASESVRMLVDIGIGPRVLAARMSGTGVRPDEITHLLITHSHVDHVSGIEGLLHSAPELSILATADTLRALPAEAQRRGRRLRPLRIVEAGAFGLTPFAVSHDAPGAVGFRLEGPDGTVAIATDLGRTDPSTVEALAGARVLVVEANHCPRLLEAGSYPRQLKRRVAGPQGHLSNLQCRELLARLLHAELAHVVLAHLSESNNTPETALRDAVGPLRASAPLVAWHVASRTGALAPITLQADAAERSLRRPVQLALPLEPGA